MPDFGDLGRILIILGLAIVVVGGALILLGRVPWIGRMPSDILIKRDGLVFYFPLLSCLILSIILTIIANVIARFIR